jgi:hypothetical protein
MSIDMESFEQRLRQLPIPHPDPQKVTATVLAKVHASRRSTPPAVRFAVALSVVVAILGGTLYFVPAAGAALASAPGARVAAEWLFRSIGLGDGTSVSPQTASVSSSGYTVRLVGLYADAFRTIAIVRITPSAYAWPDATLTDQFGQSYELLGGTGDSRTGEQALEFRPISGLASLTGARLTLHLTSVQIDGAKHVRGDWSLTGTVVRQSDRTISTPTGGYIGQTRVDFKDLARSTTAVHLTIRVAPASVLSMPPPDHTLGKPSRPGIDVAMVDSAGVVHEALEREWTDGATGTVDCVIFDIAPGTYQLRLALSGGTLVRTISVG